MTAVLHRCDAAAEAPPQVSDLVLVDHRRAQHLRWRPGERLEHLFEEQCDRARRSGRAVDVTRARVLTYGELDARANQLARHLLVRGHRAGRPDRAAVRRPVHAYVAMLAVLKVDAAYVPLDVGFPADRIAYIVADAGGDGRAVAVAPARPPAPRCARSVIAVDDMARRIAAESRARLPTPSAGRPSTTWPTSSTPPARPASPRAWPSSTRASATSSGSPPRSTACASRRPGLPGPDHRLRLLGRGDLGAVGGRARRWCRSRPAPACSGVDLHAFLAERRVTAMCCVPTLLATIEEDLPDAALPAGLRRGLPAGPDRPLAPARPAVPQRLRPDRGHRHRDLDRAATRTAR